MSIIPNMNDFDDYNDFKDNCMEFINGRFNNFKKENDLDDSISLEWEKDLFSMTITKYSKTGVNVCMVVSFLKGKEINIQDITGCNVSISKLLSFIYIISKDLQFTIKIEDASHFSFINEKKEELTLKILYYNPKKMKRMESIFL